MNLQPPTASSNPGKRFFFNIARDLEVLRAVVFANPWQLGKEKWDEACKFLKDTYQYNLKARTIKERIDLLIKKYNKEELESKTGTEEQKSERVELLREIIRYQEQENGALTIEIGPETEGVEVTSEVSSSEASKKRRIERQQADAERDVMLSSGSSSVDSAPSPNGIRRKRTRAAKEDDLIVERHKHDMELQMQKLKPKEQWQEQQIHIENRKIDLEIEKEKRKRENELRRDELATAENQRRDELMLAMCSMIKDLQSVMYNMKR